MFQWSKIKCLFSELASVQTTVWMHFRHISCVFMHLMFSLFYYTLYVYTHTTWHLGHTYTYIYAIMCNALMNSINELMEFHIFYIHILMGTLQLLQTMCVFILNAFFVSSFHCNGAHCLRFDCNAQTNPCMYFIRTHACMNTKWALPALTYNLLYMPSLKIVHKRKKKLYTNYYILHNNLLSRIKRSSPIWLCKLSQQWNVISFFIS